MFLTFVAGFTKLEFDFKDEWIVCFQSIKGFIEGYYAVFDGLLKGNYLYTVKKLDEANRITK